MSDTSTPESMTAGLPAIICIHTNVPIHVLLYISTKERCLEQKNTNITQELLQHTEREMALLCEVSLHVALSNKAMGAIRNRGARSRDIRLIYIAILANTALFIFYPTYGYRYTGTILFSSRIKKRERERSVIVLGISKRKMEGKVAVDERAAPCSMRSHFTICKPLEPKESEGETENRQIKCETRRLANGRRKGIKKGEKGQ